MARIWPVHKPELLKGVNFAYEPLTVGVDVDLGHLTEVTDFDFKQLVQVVGCDVELLMEGDDFFAYEAFTEGVGFDSEPLSVKS